MQPALELRSYSEEVQAHQHEFHQLVLPVHGQLEMTLEGRAGCATESRLALVPAGTKHGFAAPVDNCFVIADIPTELMQGIEQWPAFQALDEPLRHYVRFLYSQLQCHQGGAAERHMLHLLLQLLQQRHSGAAVPSDQRMLAVRSYMDEHFNQAITLTQLAAVAHLSVRQLSTRFREFEGETPLQYLTRVRMQRAQWLLQATPLSVQQVAEAVGYTSLAAFSDRFRQFSGQSPRYFRQHAAR
ncbi:AraC family transcriptional regulator [Bacterioplanes sanyensis]|uniref:AraC family transcriptional regulator n=1 Tax=Bacterioplanes sanyensis TaxID=1249553 RepID=A0A222FII8_9GAMM|nr:AraC family transcriptional regulator [Bacterioplanes sanyensis]ASP38569.1 AraC family transcriptional regulator [Bacterioplanes sanyensis]